jgi:hypothetical protein
MTNENNANSRKSWSLTEKVIALALFCWLFFGGGYTILKSTFTAKNIGQVTTTIGTGVQRLGAPAGVAGVLPTVAAAAATAAAVDAPSTTTKPRATSTSKLPPPPARGAGAGAGSSSLAPTVATVPTAVPTAAPAATSLPAAGGASPAAAPAAPRYEVPVGQHTEINMDGSFTVDNGIVRFYPDSTGKIVEVRIVDKNYEPAIVAEGAPPEQKIFLDPNDPDDAAALAAIPTATPSTVKGSPCRRGCPKP